MPDYDGLTEVTIECPVCLNEMNASLIWYGGDWELNEVYHIEGRAECLDSRHVNESSYMEEIYEKIRDKAIHPRMI